MLINTENPDKNKEFVAEIEDNIRFKRQNKKKNEQNRKKNDDETLQIINEILDYSKNAQKIFSLHQKLIKENQNRRLKKVLQRG